MEFELNKRSGIYAITNLQNNKRYIGYTKNLKKRKKEHFVGLKAGSYYNEHLQKAYNKYGKKAFYFSILEYCSIDMLPAREDYWVHLLKSNTKKCGYNIRPTDPNGKPGNSEETKLKISKALKGRKQNPESTKKGVETRKILFKERGYIQTPEGKQSMIAKLTGSHPNRTEEGKKSFYEKMKGNQWNKGRKCSEKGKQKLKELRMRNVKVFDLQNNFIKEFDTIKEAAKYINCNSSTISAHLSGRQQQVKGYKIKYSEDSTSLKDIKYQINKNRKIEFSILDCENSQITFNSIKEAATYLKLTVKQIYHNLRGDSKLVEKRYKFRYI